MSRRVNVKGELCYHLQAAGHTAGTGGQAAVGIAGWRTTHVGGTSFCLIFPVFPPSVILSLPPSLSLSLSPSPSLFSLSHSFALSLTLSLSHTYIRTARSHRMALILPHGSRAVSASGLLSFHWNKAQASPHSTSCQSQHQRLP